MILNQLADVLLDLFFPPRCQVCRAVADDPLCETCRSIALFIEQDSCVYCGVPLPVGVPGPLCAYCRRGRQVSGARAVGLHTGALREAVIRYKFHGRRSLAAPLAQMLADVVAREAQTCGLPLAECAAMIPVPLHHTRLRWRGFNQAQLLCEELAQEADIPVWPDVLVRHRQTDPQVHLSGDTRRANVRGAFEVRNSPRLRNRSVLLVDDVFTTGATVEECALVLRRAGAAAVYALTITRALPVWTIAATFEVEPSAEELAGG